MQDIFYEESVSQHDEAPARRRYILFTVFGVLCAAMAAFSLFTIAMTLVMPPPSDGGWTDEAVRSLWLGMIPWAIALVVMTAGAAALLVRRHSFYVSYDYTFVSGELRIGKVFHGRKRKPLYAVGSDRLILMGRYDSATYRKSKASPDVKEDILTPNPQPGEGKEFFYILAVTNAGKRLLVLECRIELLSNILRWTRKNILESEFNQK